MKLVARLNSWVKCFSKPTSVVLLSVCSNMFVLRLSVLGLVLITFVLKSLRVRFTDGAYCSTRDLTVSHPSPTKKLLGRVQEIVIVAHMLGSALVEKDCIYIASVSSKVIFTRNGRLSMSHVRSV